MTEIIIKYRFAVEYNILPVFYLLDIVTFILQPISIISSISTIQQPDRLLFG